MTPDRPADPADQPLMAADRDRLLHELQVHQVELEAQNTALGQMQETLEASRAEFVDLFDMMPVGYCSVNKAGLITRANRTLAKMLGVARGAVIGQPMSRFILRDYQDVYYKLRNLRPQAVGRAFCELRMGSGAGRPFWARLDTAERSRDTGELLISVAEIGADRRVQAELRANAAAFKAISQGVVVATPDSLIVSVNAAFTAITGYSEAEVLGRNCRFLQGVDSDPHTVAAIHAAVHQRTEFAGEILNYRKDGNPFWNALTISPVLDAQGDLTHFIGVTRDISETISTRRALEASYTDLKHASELLEHTGALARVGGWALDLQTMRLTWTRETFRIFEIEPPIAPSLEQAIHLYLPAARPAISDAMQATMANGTPYDLELPLVTASGWHKWVRTQGFAEMPGGKPTRLYGTIRDITELRLSDAAQLESESFVRTIAENVPGALTYWGVDLTCRFANGVHQSWFGRTAGEMAGTSLRSALGDVLFAQDEPLIRAVFSGENVRFERALTTVAGDTLDTLVQYIAHWKDGKVAGFIALITDISAIKKVQERLALSLQDKEGLLKEVHHRVKNNLQVITSLLRLESRRSGVPEVVDVLKAMQGRVQTMAHLHESLYRSGTFASVDLGAYLGQIATQAYQTHLLPGSRVQLKLDMGSVPAGMDQAIVCGLLVNELVSNSLKHGFPQARSGEVCVEMQPSSPATVQADALWHLRVSDSGVGLPPEFEELRQRSLGLQLVDDLSQQAQGQLTVQSQPGAGAQFSILLRVEAPAPLVMPA